MEIETTIDHFPDGITNDPRGKEGAAIITNFDVFTDPKKLTPYYDSESGDSAASTSQKQNFAIALRTGTTYSLYSLGVVSGTARAEILYKNLTTGAATDLDDDGWTNTSNNQSASGAASFGLFVYYKKRARIFFANAGTTIGSYDPSGTAAINDENRSISYTNIAQGLVHSKDDILYIPYDNKIAKNDNNSWTDTALVLPSHFYITSICEYGNYLAIACAPLSGVGSSRVYLWDRDSTLATLSESIDWGEGVLNVLEELDGYLIGISTSATATRTRYRVLFKRWIAGTAAQRFQELTSSSSPVLNIAKQKVDNRLYFMLVATVNGAIRSGVWSIGRKNPSSEFILIHERTPDNDTALGAGVLKNFFIVGDFMFISYVNNSSAYALSKTNDQSSYTATSIYESRYFDGSQKHVDRSLKKKLKGITVTYEPLPSSGQVVVKYKKDEDTSFTTIFTDSTDNSISHSSINIESTKANLPEYKEIAFRFESTGGAVIRGYSFKEEVTGKRTYE